jgi:hypothetical protein
MYVLFLRLNILKIMGQKKRESVIKKLQNYNIKYENMLCYTNNLYNFGNGSLIVTGPLK